MKINGTNDEKKYFFAATFSGFAWNQSKLSEKNGNETFKKQLLNPLQNSVSNYFTFSFGFGFLVLSPKISAFTCNLKQLMPTTFFAESYAIG